MPAVYGRDNISSIARKTGLPNWWVESVIVEYLDCRRHAEEGELWAFDFTGLSGDDIQAVSSAKVVIPNYYLFQNIRESDLGQRALHLMVGLPVVPLDQAQLIPEGLVNSTAFPSPIRNDISVWDHKLEFNSRAIVIDEGVFYQWTIAEFFKVPGKHYGWYKSSLFNLDDLFRINRKLQDYRNSGVLKKPRSEIRNAIAEDYQALERIRAPLREMILEYHGREKGKFDRSTAMRPEPPMLSFFEAVKPTDNGYEVKTHMEPLLLRSAIRNCLLARNARQRRNDDPKDHGALLDEMEFSCMSIIASINCLESYINYLIKEHLPGNAEPISFSIPHKKKWLRFTKALNNANVYEEDQSPFKEFAAMVEKRDSIIHHVPHYVSAQGSTSHTFNEFNLESAEEGIWVIREMVSRLSARTIIPLPRWISTDAGGAEFWNEVSAYLKSLK